jgi:hypothetical protein
MLSVWGIVIKKRDRQARCHYCEAILPARRRTSCPRCGKPLMGATVGASLGSPINSSPASDTRRAFYESHKPVAVLMILIIFSFPILGVFIRGVSGLLIGVASSVSAYYVVPYAVLKMHGRRTRE